MKGKLSLTVRFCVFLALVACLSVGASAQSLVAGDIAGTVTDSSHAVIPNIVVNLKSLDTGASLTAKTNATGAYRFTLLKPGTYRVSIAETGFAPFSETTSVSVGLITTANIALKVSGAATTIEVTSEATLISVEPGSSTAFTQQDMELLPSAGADITNIAETAPGVTMNNGGGNMYGGGNFSANGLPGVSNLFTVNGENDMDPYFNVNNSGAVNLTMGQNEIAEAAVLTNAYSGQYGQLSGAQVTYVTKSGTNKFHGNAQWWWNGVSMNANDWMNKNLGASKPFSNNNQWATSVGGPIFKNRTFFFADYEGVRFILPSGGTGYVPSSDFATAVYNNVLAVQPNSAPLFKSMFGLYSAATAGKTLTPYAVSGCNPSVTKGVGSLAPGFTADAATDNCVNAVALTPSALGKEFILAARIDQHISDKDTLYGRYKIDHGVQPTLEDQISPNFSANSNQPSYDIQLNETHIFSPRSTNQIMVTGSHYVAQFAQTQPLANNTFPAFVAFGSTMPFTDFNYEQDFPQGRNITQYQVIDDFTWTLGRHNLKFGENFRRYLISDHNFFFNYPETYWSSGLGGTAEFVNGLALEYRRSLNVNTDVPIKMYGLGMYAQDEWAVTRSLKLTLALRVEHDGNPVCGTKCFANFVSPFATLPSTAAGAGGGNVPYDTDIKTGIPNAFSGVDALNVSPRIGFSWSPKNDSTLVVSGGFGVFFDGPPAGLLDNLTQNAPYSTNFRVEPTGGTLAFDPTHAGSAYTFGQSAAAFSTGFAAGGTYNSIKAALLPYGVNFAAPAFTALVGTFHSPKYYEWNFQVQKEIARGTAVIANYVGNKGSNIPYANAWPNGWDQYATYGSPIIPQTPPNPNYGTIIQWQSGANSTYNGVNLSVRHQASRALTMHVNYTWSHGLDDMSNGGAVSGNIYNLSSSFNTQLLPTGLRQGNYGNADYDIRQSLNADYVLAPSFKINNHLASAFANGWQWSGKIFLRSGLPFSIVDGNYTFGNGAAGGTILAQPLAGMPGTTGGGCGGGNANSGGSAPPCLLASGFYDAAGSASGTYPAFSTQERNQYRGPHYFDVDMGLAKNFTIFDNLKLGLGVQAFNVFNHPNFNEPLHDISDGSAFGVITSMAVLPTTPYGSGLGYSSEARLVQLTAKITF
ncbi:MAG: carboxypeptidase regulatory-like domain-containing protein [Candidatus Korobacteraceae bacterium]|jgi:hypothetical protein